MSRLLALTFTLAVGPALVACGSLYPTQVAYDHEFDSMYYDGLEYETSAVPPGEDIESVEVFYDALSEHGSWVEDAEHGYVFAPYDDYIPYSDGRWVYTEYGMTWVSDHPIDWAVAHYGRWYYQDRWLWIPDTVWGPSWVEWRVGGGYVGWAPLGIAYYGAPLHYWRYVPTSYVFHTGLSGYYLQPHRVRVVHTSSRPVHRYVRGYRGHRYIAGPSARTLGVRPRPAHVRALPPHAVGRVSPTHRARPAHRDASHRASAARSERRSRAGLAPGADRPRPAPRPRYDSRVPRSRSDAAPRGRFDGRRGATPPRATPPAQRPRSYAPPSRTPRPRATTPSRTPHRATTPSRRAPSRATTPSRRAPNRATAPPSRTPHRATTPSRTPSRASTPSRTPSRASTPSRRAPNRASTPSRSPSRASTPSRGGGNRAAPRGGGRRR